MNRARHTKFTVGRKCVDVYPAEEEGRPVLYLNSFSPDSESLLAELNRMDCPDFSLAVISNLEWDHDMAPWDIPPISPDDTPCTGGADAYLSLMLEEILPRTEEMLNGAGKRGIAGYSLAGLFAVYAMYRTDAFPLAASMSGSLWFPGFKEYAVSHEMKRRPDHLYLSLGDQECRTGNPFLKTVQKNTEELAGYYRGRRIDTEFRLNPGNHYKEPFRRTAMGIHWLLTRELRECP